MPAISWIKDAAAITRPAFCRSRAAGQALVESALVLSVLIFLLIGIVDLGQLMFLHQTFTERVRATVRYAIANNYDTNQITNVLLYNDPNGSGTPLLGLNASEVTVTRFNAGDRINDRIEISIQNYPMAIFSPLIAGAYTHRPFIVVRPVEALGATN